VTLALSIVIPTFNRPALLKRAVQSAFAACPESAEIIVVDDRSYTAVDALVEWVNQPEITIVTNTGAKGAAGARNEGARLARGQIILFFDDDDTLVEDYPERVIQAAQQSDAVFGFSSLIGQVDGQIRKLDRPRLNPGVIDIGVPLRHKLAAFSAGFWIHRNTLNEVGGIAVDQTTDEDTDLCCRLHGMGFKAWFDPRPGCTVYRGYTAETNTEPQLTQSTDPLVSASCQMRTFQRNQHYFELRSADRWFLLRRALRTAAKHRADVVAKTLLKGLRPFSWQVKGWLLWKSRLIQNVIKKDKPR